MDLTNFSKLIKIVSGKEKYFGKKVKRAMGTGNDYLSIGIPGSKT